MDKELGVLLKLEQNGDEVELKSEVSLDAKEGVYKLEDFFFDELKSIALSHVTILSLSNCELKSLPYSIQKLRLKQLILCNNKLEEVPSLLYSGLISLELLDLSGNFIKTFDIEPACCRNLVRLNLNDNELHSLPQWILIGQAESLRELLFSRNRVLRFEPDHRHGFETLEMRNCALYDYHCGALKALKRLRTLHIGNSAARKLENSIRNFDELFTGPKWRDLRVLSLDNSMISILPPSLFGVCSLVELSLVNCDLSWICGEIGRLARLEMIDLSRNLICALPAELCALPKLKILKAPYNNISSISAPSPGLEWLDLYENTLDFIPAGLENTRLLDLERNYFNTTSICAAFYAKKMETLRANVGDVRGNGPREPPPPSPADSNRDDDSDSIESFSYNLSPHCVTPEEDFWESEQQTAPSLPYIKNPLITDSDEEWTGDEKNLVVDTPKKTIPSDFSQDSFLYCDVD